jgi:D-sedoheptulose 7-phosphate isomerase
MSSCHPTPSSIPATTPGDGLNPQKTRLNWFFLDKAEARRVLSQKAGSDKPGDGERLQKNPPRALEGDAVRDDLLRCFRESAEVKLRFAETHAHQIEAVARRMAGVLRRGGKLLFCGNGGSAADAQHLAAEFVNRFLGEREALAALSLTTDTSALTSIGNDRGFDQVFSRQVEALARPGDLLVGISTSGGSPNVVQAVVAARRRGCYTVAFSGGDGGPLAAAADEALTVSSRDTPRIQETHITLGHVLCALVEQMLRAAPAEPPENGSIRGVPGRTEQ